MMNSVSVKVVRDGLFEEVLQRYAIDGTILPFRGVYRIAGTVPKILKPLKTGAFQAYTVGKLLAQSDGSLIPKLVKTAEGREYLWHRGNRYLVTEQMPGVAADYRNDWDLDAAIIAMERWHRFSKDLMERNVVPGDLLRFDIQRIWRKRFLEMDACREMAIRRQDAFSRAYLQKWRDIADQAYETQQEFMAVSIAPQPPQVFCYHDWAFHNVLINGPTAHLIDFDLMIIDAAVHDRANLIGRYLRLFQWQEKALLKILWKFDRRYPWRRGEIRLLRMFLGFPYEYWMLGRQYFIEKQAWSDKYYWDQWRRKVVDQENRPRALALLKQLESRG